MTAKRTWVYFLRAGDLLKVGLSTFPERRIEQLQTGCPYPIILLGTLVGGRKEERRIHDTLKHYRTSGEWFNLARPPVQEYLDAILPEWRKRKEPHTKGRGYRKAKKEALLPCGVLENEVDRIFRIKPDYLVVDLDAFRKATQDA